MPTRDQLLLLNLGTRISQCRGLIGIRKEYHEPALAHQHIVESLLRLSEAWERWCRSNKLAQPFRQVGREQASIIRIVAATHNDTDEEAVVVPAVLARLDLLQGTVKVWIEESQTEKDPLRDWLDLGLELFRGLSTPTSKEIHAMRRRGPFQAARPPSRKWRWSNPKRIQQLCRRTGLSPKSFLLAKGQVASEHWTRQLPEVISGWSAIEHGVQSLGKNDVLQTQTVHVSSNWPKQKYMYELRQSATLKEVLKAVNERIAKGEFPGPRLNTDQAVQRAIDRYADEKGLSRLRTSKKQQIKRKGTRRRV